MLRCRYVYSDCCVVVTDFIFVVVIVSDIYVVCLDGYVSGMRCIFNTVMIVVERVVVGV